MARAEEHFTWQLRAQGLVPADDIEVALTLDAAELTYGPYLFAFTKTPLADGSLLLSLQPRGRADGRGDGEGRDAEILDECPGDQVIPAVTGDLGPEQRRELEAHYLRILGRALFDDVAHIVEINRRFA